jgi:hypothetical protein
MVDPLFDFVGKRELEICKFLEFTNTKKSDEPDLIAIVKFPSLPPAAERVVERSNDRVSLRRAARIAPPIYSPRQRCDGRPSLRLRRKEGTSVSLFNIEVLNSPFCRLRQREWSSEVMTG